MYTSERLSMLERESDEQNLMEMKTLIFFNDRFIPQQFETLFSRLITKHAIDHANSK